MVTINDDDQNQSTLSLNDTLVGPDIEEIVIKKKRKRNMRDEVSSDAMSTNSSPMKKRKRKYDHNVDVEHTQDTECRQDENAEESFSQKKKKKKKAKKMKENLENV